jgi:AcrR family transcriptional regulator
MVTSPARRRAPRKSAAKSRELIIEAARELFGRQGFTNTGVKDVATRAGVAEIVVYRVFGTKAQLFEEVIFGQLVEAIVGWLERWSERDPGAASSWESGRAYIEGVYRMVSANRGQILALLAAEAFEPAFAGERGTPSPTNSSQAGSSPINDALHRIESLVGREAAARGWHGVDVALATRVTFSMIFSVAMFRDTLLPPGPERPPDDRIIDEMTAYMIYGVSGRP